MSQYAVIDPSTGATVKTYPEISEPELEEAVGAAHLAHAQWGRSTDVHERAALLRAVGDLHLSRREELARVISREMGKPHEQALVEVDFSADIYHYYARHAAVLLSDDPIDDLVGAGSAVVRKGSLGVLFGIMPWNYPYYQVARFAAPNLVIGNTVLLKHALQCPESAGLLHELFLEAGFPPGAYTNVYASHEQVARVIADDRVRGVSLTGSERAGAAVAEIAGRNLKKVVLELGGSDPFILLSTGDLDTAVADAVNARLENSGQACNAAKRFIVIDALFESFLDKFVARLDGARMGDPASPGIDIGPLSSEEAAIALEKQVERAVAQGATIVAGGSREGAFFPPTVLTGVTADMDAYREEFFGPVACVYRARDEEEAILLANDSPFGLGSYLYSSDAEQSERVADRLEAGMVFVNMVGAESAELPFGGVKRSGFGRELGRAGIAEFVNAKLIRRAP